jgi:putative flippase GtrA
MTQIRNSILTLYSSFRNLILYGIIGSFSAGSDFVIFYILTTICGVFYLPANIISVSVGISISFLLNRKFNFQVKDNVFKRFVLFFTIGLAGLFISSLLLYCFINLMDLDKIISKVLSIVGVVLMQFFLNKNFTFKKLEL